MTARFDLGGFRRQPLPTEDELRTSWPNRGPPLVSVICSTFNHAKLIHDAFRGLVFQRTTFPFEVIIHDDASTDGTADVARTYALRYPNVMKVVAQRENQFSQGRKPTPLALKHASGEFIALCEGDDFWIDPEKLELQARFLQAHPAYSACSGWALVLENDQVKAPRRVSGKGVITHQDILIGLKENCGTASMMFRRRSLPAEFPVEMGQVHAGDNLLRTMATMSGPVYVLARYLSCYRLHANGMWSTLRGDVLYRKQMHDLALLRNLVAQRDRPLLDCRIAILQLSRCDWGAIGGALKALLTVLSHPIVAGRILYAKARRRIAGTYPS